jgi:hypothetical protein
MVTSKKTLAGMAKAGLIKWEDGSDKHWTGRKVNRVWVEEGSELKRWSDPFTYKGKNYRLRYVDGCSKPFVFEETERPPEFV